MSTPLFYHHHKFSSGDIDTFELTLDKNWIKNFCDSFLTIIFDAK